MRRNYEKKFSDRNTCLKESDENMSEYAEDGSMYEEDGCDGICEHCDQYDFCHEPTDDDYEEEDSGFLGSMLESQLIHDGQEICSICGKKVSSVLDKENPNPCKAEVHADFKRLFDVRIKIGLHDLKTRGYD